MEYVINPHPEGRPYGKEPFGFSIWGADGIYDVTVTIHASYKILKTYEKILKTFYKINAKPAESDPTIEDIYSYATYRFMALGCLDGPILPFTD